MEIVEVYRDENVSGAIDPIDRPGFQAMIQRVAQGHASIILCTKVDRFARVASAWETYVNVLKTKGVFLESLETLKLRGMDRMMRVVMTGHATMTSEIERIMISDRTKMALDQKRSKGEVFGKCPYGWKAVATDKPVPKGKRPIKDLVPDEQEQENITKIHELYETDQASGIQGVRRALADLGVATRKGHCNWSYATVKSILDRGRDYDPTIAVVEKPEEVPFIVNSRT
jgi:DNA invertase Pin-like site-specific DNA recombinase